MHITTHHTHEEIYAKSWIDLTNLILSKKSQKEKEYLMHDCIYVRLKSIVRVQAWFLLLKVEVTGEGPK